MVPLAKDRLRFGPRCTEGHCGAAEGPLEGTGFIWAHLTQGQTPTMSVPVGREAANAVPDSTEGVSWALWTGCRRDT